VGQACKNLGNIYIDDNVYFVDPTFKGSPEKQRFSKFNDPLDDSLYQEPPNWMQNPAQRLMQLMHAGPER